MDPQPSGLVIPEVFICGRGDCQPRPLPPMPTIPRKPAKPKPDCRSGNLSSAAKKLRSAPSSASFIRGCPQDDSAGDTGEVIGSSQKEFLASVDVKESERLLFNYFVAHLKKWISMVRLAKIAKIHAVHSRIPAVRNMIPRDHDIDQVTRKVLGKPHSFYRLCLKTDSKRLKRLAAREQDATKEMI